MPNLEELRSNYEQADQRAIELSNQYDQERQALKDRYASELQQANQVAADAQKQYADAEAAHALLDQPDGERVAASLGLTLPE